MYKVRFNLGRGDNYRKWKVENIKTKTSVYYDPEKVVLSLINAKLVNRPMTARQIYKGSAKTVCAWVYCEEVEVSPSVPKTAINTSRLLLYNPKINPYWRDWEGNNLDSRKYCLVKSAGKLLYFIIR